MKILLWLAAIVGCQLCNAQQLVPYRQNKLWGFANEKGEVIIQPRYSSVEFFGADGFARVYNDTTVTAIDKSGKELLPFQYTAIFEFSDGLAAVCRGGKFNWIQGEIVGGKWGFVNEKFEEVIPCKYSRAQRFVNGYSIVQAEDNWGNWGLIDKTGKQILPFQFATYSFDMRPFPGLIWGPTKGTLQKDISGRGERWQIIGINGKPIGAPFSAMHGKSAFNEKPQGEDYYFKKFPVQGREVKLISPAGKTITLDRSKTSFESLGNNLFAVSVKKETSWDEAEKRPATALVNTSGKILVDFDKYDFFMPYSDGALAVSKNGRYGYIDASSGNEIAKPIYDHAERFNNGFAKVYYNYFSRYNTISGYINKSGKEFFKDDPVIHAVSAFQTLLLLDERNYLVHRTMGPNFQVDGRYIKLFNSNGEIDTLAESSVPILQHDGWENYCCQLGTHTYTGIDTTGNRIKIIDLKKENGVFYRGFGDTLIQMTKGDKLGLKTNDGKTILPPTFTKIEITAFSYKPAKNEIAFAAATEDKFGFYSSSGVELAAQRFDSYSVISDVNRKFMLMAQLTRPDGEQRVCVLDLTGKIVFPDVCSTIEPIGESPKYQLIQINENNGILKNYTTLLLPPEYGDISMITWGKQTFFTVYKYKKGNALLDSAGKIILDYGFANDVSPEESFPTDGPAFFILYQKKKYGLARSDKGVILPFEYNNIEVSTMDSSRGQKRFFLIEKNKKKGVCTIDGKILVAPVNEYIELVTFYGRPYIIFKKKGLYGLANENGQIVLAASYKTVMLESPEYFDVTDKSFKQYRFGKDLKLEELKE